MSIEDFRDQIAVLTEQLQGRALDEGLQAWLNAEYGVDSDTFDRLQQSCRRGVAEGWLCEREAGGTTRETHRPPRRA